MEPDTSSYLGSLKVASMWMLRHLHNEVFMKWVSRYLVTDLNPSHVSIALYEPAKGAFPIKISTGKNRFPSRLVALQPRSPLIQGFLSEERLPDSGSHRLITYEDLERGQVPLSHSILEELRRHRTEVCAMIETHDQLAGCLLIGPREDGHPYTREDIDLFETLANDIAIEIEREEYYRLSRFDPLTGLLNRHRLDLNLQTLIERARRGDGEFSVALIDLDHFKKINDQFGHRVGDEVLRITAEIIRGSIRKSDLAFRYGGEEFLLLLAMNSRNPNNPPLQGQAFRGEIYRVLERLRERIAGRSFNCLGHNVQLTVSIGVSFYDGKTSELKEDLIHEADQALYRAKQRGKNQTSLFIESAKQE